MSVAESIKLEREKRKRLQLEQRFERERLLYDRFLTPNTVRLLLVLGIIAYSTYCTRSKHEVGPIQGALAFAGPGIGIPMLAADAGITDWKALAGISAAGLGYTGLSMAQGWDARTTLEAMLGALPGIGPTLAEIVD